MAPNPKRSCSAALLFLSLVFAFGCTKAAEQDGKKGLLDSVKDEQIVCVTLADLNPGTKPMPSVNPVKLSQAKGEMAHWVFCGEGKLTITWKPGVENPFEGDFDEADKHTRSARPRKAAIGPKPYGYTITITIPGKPPFTNDPEVEIMP